MKEFAIKHPWITALLIVPTVVWGTVTLVRGYQPRSEEKSK